jgi:hypothetical protein
VDIDAPHGSEQSYPQTILGMYSNYEQTHSMAHSFIDEHWEWCSKDIILNTSSDHYQRRDDDGKVLEQLHVLPLRKNRDFPVIAYHEIDSDKFDSDDSTGTSVLE